MKSSVSKSRMQGEGNYDASREYDEKTKAFAESGKVEQAARAAAPRNAQEKEDMRQAEAEGRSRAKGSPKDDHDDGASPARHKPDRKAPADHPDGYNPAPRKVPGR